MVDLNSVYTIQSGGDAPDPDAPVIDGIVVTDLNADLWQFGAQYPLPEPSGAEVYLEVFSLAVTYHEDVPEGITWEGFTGSLNASLIDDTGALLAFADANVTASEIDASFEVAGGSFQVQTVKLLTPDADGNGISVSDGGTVTAQNVEVGDYGTGIHVFSDGSFTAQTIQFDVGPGGGGIGIDVEGGTFLCESSVVDPWNMAVDGGSATINGNLEVDQGGVAANGTLKVTGDLSGSFLLVGDEDPTFTDEDGPGTVSIGGGVTDSTVSLTAGSDLKVGAEFDGSIQLTDGSTAEIGGFLSAGVEAGGSDTVFVGDQSTLTVAGTLDIGFLGTGTFSVNGGTVDANGGLREGVETLSNALMTITGAFSSIIVNGNYLVGVGGKSTDQVQGAAQIKVQGDLILGDLSTGAGSQTISGTDTQETVSGQITIGDTGIGHLTVSAGASLSSTYSAGTAIDLGVSNGSHGFMTVSDSGTNLVFATGQSVIVGDAGTGTFTVQNGATFQAISADPNAFWALNLGRSQTGAGFVTVDGEDSTLTVGSGGLSVGDAGSGDLTVSNGGNVAVTDATFGVVVGTLDNSNGTINITGQDSTLNSVGPILMAEGNQSTSAITVTGTGASLIDTDELVAGEQGSARVTVSQGANVSIGSQNDLSQFDSLYLGAQANSSGVMTATDANTTVSVNGQVDVGLAGTGYLTLQNGATMTTGDATGGTAEGIDIGTEKGGTGDFIVQGQNTQLNNTGLIIVGEDGNGTWTIADGAQVATSIDPNLQVSGLDVATGAGSVGTINIKGTNTSFTATDIDLTSQGTAIVAVSSGAQVTDSGDFKLEPQDNGTVNFTVTGASTSLTISGTTSIGGKSSKNSSTGGSATLNIQDHATVNAQDLIIAPNAAPKAKDSSSNWVQTFPTQPTPSGPDPVTGFSTNAVQVVNVNGDATLHVNQLTVGQVGNGALIVAGGMIIADDTLTIGDQSGSQGQLLLDGNDSSLQSSDVTVGNSGKGLLSIGNGNAVTTNGDATIGAEAGGSGFVVVGDGSGGGGANWSISGSLTVGDSGSGTLTVTPASSLEVGGDMVIGGQSGGSGHVTFTDGSLSMGGTITVGDQGGGSLVFQTGATMGGGMGLQVPSIVIGETLGISGSMSVTDVGTSVEVQNLTVGEAGTGSLSVKAGGKLLVDGTADVGADAIGAIQKLTLDTGGKMSVTGDLTLGTAALASVSIKDGAQLAGDSNVVLGDESGGGAGIVTVSGASGAPGNMTASGLGYGLTLTIGNSGIGNLTISSGALVAPTPGGTGDIEVAAKSGSQGTVTLSGSGSALKGDTLSLGGSSTAVGGLAKLSIGSGSHVTIADDAHLWSTAVVTLSGGEFSVGTATIDKGASISGNGTLAGTFTDNGVISASGGALDVLDTLSGSGSLNINGGATLDLFQGVSGVKIQFKGTDDKLQIQDVSGVASTIAGFTFGDTIELDGLIATSAEDTNGKLDVFDGSNLVASFNVSGNYKGAVFDVVTNEQGSTITLDASQPGSVPVVSPNPILLSLPSNVVATAGNTMAVQGASITDSAASSTITLEVLAGNGLLAANTGVQGGGGTVSTAPDGTGLIITGTASEINADLSTLTYTATASGTDTLQFVANDSSGNADEDAGTVSVPDAAPTLSLPPGQTVSADQATGISGITVNDTINAEAAFTVDVSDLTGTLSVDTDGASTVTGSGTAAIIITGDLADVNTDLASLTYTGASTGLNTSADDMISVAVDDGLGGTSDGSVNVTVDQAPDEIPYIVAPVSTTLTSSGAATPLTGIGILINDYLGKTYSVTLSDVAGSLAVNQDGTSLVTGDNSNAVTVTGDYADVNADLASLTYTGIAAAFGTSETDTLAITVSDNEGLTANATTDVTIVAPSTSYWQLPIDGMFNDATQWTPSGAPGPEQTAVFGAGAYTVEGPGSAGIIDVTGAVNFSGDLSAVGNASNAQTFVVDGGGAATFETGASLTVGGNSDAVQTIIGEKGDGSLTIDQGAALTEGGAIIIADQAGATGTLTLDGTQVANSGVGDAGDWTVGNQGSGQLIAENAAVLSGLNEIDVGAQAYGIGSIDLSGQSQIVATALAIGGTATSVGGQGDLTISDTSSVSVSDLTVWGNGSIDLQGGSLFAQDNLSIQQGGVITGEGILGSAAITDNGEIDVGANDSLEVAAPISGTGVIDIRAGGTLQIDQMATGAAGGQNQEFNVAIAGFTPEDAILIGTSGLGNFSTIDGYSLAAEGNDTALTLTDAGNSVATLTLNGDYTGDIFSIYTNPYINTIDISEAPCYCPGTLIETDQGPKAVQALSIGDRVMTMSGRSRPIKWIGKRSYSGRFALGQKHILPICFKAGSLDDNVPSRDLWISPHHAMYLEGVLIEAKDLVNGVSIVQVERVEKVEYFHIELESHDVIIAEGSLSESFIDDDSRGMFHNAREYTALYPGIERVAARYCAPRLSDGYEVEAARRHINVRAGLRPAVTEARATLRGNIDVINADRIEGWAQNPAQPEAPICLDIFVGGKLIGRALANRHREDLRKAGLGSGRHSFVFVPETGRPIGSGTIEVRRSSDGEFLASSTACNESSIRNSGKLNRSAILKRAWEMFRDDNAHISCKASRQPFAACLREAWAEAKGSAQTLKYPSRVRLSA